MPQPILLPEEAKRKARDNKRFWAESNVQCAIVAMLRASLPPSYRVISVPNGRFKADPRTIARLKREGLTAGVFDLLLLRNDGTYASIEVKAEKGKLSSDQEEWSQWLGRGGAEQAIVHSVEEAEHSLRAWNVPLRGRIGA